MKKKYFLIIMSIIGILLCLNTLYHIDDFVKEQIVAIEEVYKSIGSNNVTNITKAIEQNGHTIFTIINLVSILLYMYIGVNAFKDELETKRNKLLAASIGLFITSSNSITELIAVLYIVIFSFTKHKKEKKKQLITMPPPSRTSNSYKKSLILLVVYFSQLIWGSLIPRDIALLANIIFDVVLLSLTIYLFKTELINGFKDLKQQPKEYFHYLLQKYLIGMGIMIVVSTIAITITNNPVSVNQETLNSLPLWYILPASIIFAPIVEETVFRVCFRTFIKNDKIYIIISGLVFGYLHAMHEANLLNVIVMTLPYATLGSMFAYIYVKTNNPTGSMAVHAGHNTMASILSILIR